MRHSSITNSVVCTAEEIGPSEEIPRMNAGKGLSDIQKIWSCCLPTDKQ